MSVGTKVSLVVGVLFAAVLAFYYGVGSPVKNDLESASKNQASENLKQVAAIDKATAQLPTKTRQTNRPSLRGSTSQRRGILSESVQRTLGSSQSLEEANITPLSVNRMRRNKGSGGSKVQDNLAKDSGQNSAPVKAEPKAVDPLRRKVAEKPRSTSFGKPRTTPYSVKKDDSMWTIAKAWFGEGSKWNLIAQANPYVDPDRLKLGQILQLPPKGAGPRPKPARIVRDTPNTYRVKHGDSLSSIAGKYYGDETKWRIIYEANRDVIGNDPGALELGARLRIPPKSS
ncbi:MAG: LysM peptidoglycan-binding domain-containing protein [Planctomycetes bacterium]|nr:LysM peptidoglycan-binding domain-containing protein [Planctomycetota bacterium]